jgi:two-component system OmpR family sensor kinase
VALTLKSQAGRDGQPGRVRFAVHDRGPGLSAQDRERVFERFYRTDSARNRTAGGTGLGLSIVAALVAAHGGWMRAESVPGQGATFAVELPLHDGGAGGP